MPNLSPPSTRILLIHHTDEGKADRPDDPEEEASGKEGVKGAAQGSLFFLPCLVCSTRLTQLPQLMNAGEDELINGQAELLANIAGTIRDLTLRKQQLHIFASKMESARMNQEIGASMVQVSQALSVFKNKINLEKVDEVMENLARQYEDIDVMTKVLDSATQQGSAVTASPEQVEAIKRKVADAAGLELKESLGSVPESSAKVGPTKEEEEASSERLKALRQMA